MITTLLLVASMASRRCPENCECINNNEVRCENTPRSLPTNESERISVVGTRGACYEEITGLMLDLEARGNAGLCELAIANCSLTHFNVPRIVSSGFSLNLSRNAFVDTRQLTIQDGERLARLDLSMNRLSRVRRRAFVEYGQLVQLNLRRNVIGVIEEDAFAGLARLESLDLSDNRLVALAEDTFVPLCYLKKLNLSGNRGVLVTINRLSLLLLGSVATLEMLEASRIGLESVPSALARSVAHLDLSGNRLTIIRSGDFDGYPLLRILDLSYNRITALEEDALGRLEILEKLDLTGNRLTQLPRSLPSHLERLALGGNLMTKLARDDLDGLGRLKSLRLDGNTISEIEEGSMSELSLLEELDLSNNPIQKLSAGSLDGAANLVVVRMSGLSSIRDRDEPFPVAATGRLVSLDLSASPALATRLLNDETALSAYKSLNHLDVSRANLTELRPDLPYLLPRLHTLGLSDNRWNCTQVVWLARWIRQHEEIRPFAECIDDRTSRTTLLADSLDDYTRATEMTLHPGILACVGALLAVAALGVAFSQRRAVIDRSLYQEQQQQQQPIITELW